MDRIFTEENGCYYIDCSKAVWATDEINSQYHTAKCFLSDVDWIVETDEKLILVEYKNANVEGARHPEAFEPKGENTLNKVTKKFYDSLHYLALREKEKPKDFVYILEYPNGDSSSRKMIRNRLKTKLPFELQKNISEDRKLIEKVEVLSIEEWNADEQYGVFPVRPCE